MAQKYGAEGIGMYRTEFLFTSKEQFPSLDEQYEDYKELFKENLFNEVTIRTLDIGGDKIQDYSHLENNPALGLRGIRYSLDKNYKNEAFSIEVHEYLNSIFFTRYNTIIYEIHNDSDLSLDFYGTIPIRVIKANLGNELDKTEMKKICTPTLLLCGNLNNRLVVIL